MTRDVAFAALLTLVLALEGNAQTNTSTPMFPVYIQRGDEVEGHYRRHKERLQRVYAEKLVPSVQRNVPDLLPKLEAAAPKPLQHGYLILPKLLPDGPPPAQRLRATSTAYSWPRTRQLIDRDAQTLTNLETELAGVVAQSAAEQRPVYERFITAYRRLSESLRTIDSHLQYNRLWQSVIAHNLPNYQQQTVLHDAVLERQAVQDAFAAPDEVTFRTALGEIKNIDDTRAREVVEWDLKAREQTLARAISEATDSIPAPSFLRVLHPTPHLWILQVPFSTDIADTGFVRAVQTAIETLWQVRDGEDEFRVQMTISVLPVAQLYGQQPAPQQGEAINLQAHLVRFPAEAAILTTGAATTHVSSRWAIVLGPHDISAHTLAHEFGHILGFKDVYFRGYKDLGAEGYQVMEVIADPGDIMGAPGSGPVLRRHFERIIQNELDK